MQHPATLVLDELTDRLRMLGEVLEVDVDLLAHQIADRLAATQFLKDPLKLPVHNLVDGSVHLGLPEQVDHQLLDVSTLRERDEDLLHERLGESGLHEARHECIGEPRFEASGPSNGAIVVVSTIPRGAHGVKR